jgi:hypothetical protein
MTQPGTDAVRPMDASLNVSDHEAAGGKLVGAAAPTVFADLLLRAHFALVATPSDVASAIRKRRKVAA